MDFADFIVYLKKWSFVAERYLTNNSNRVMLLAVLLQNAFMVIINHRNFTTKSNDLKLVYDASICVLEKLTIATGGTMGSNHRAISPTYGSNGLFQVKFTSRRFMYKFISRIMREVKITQRLVRSKKYLLNIMFPVHLKCTVYVKLNVHLHFYIKTAHLLRFKSVFSSCSLILNFFRCSSYNV